jgi:hypothetical protein
MKKIPTEDAQLIRQLQELYFETEMRRALLWRRNEFWPDFSATSKI